MTVENLERVHAGVDLHLQISGDGGGEFPGERIKSFPVFPKEAQGADVFPGAAAFHHKRGQRPRRTREADERGLVAEFLPKQAQRLVHVAEAFGHALDGKALDIGPCAHGKVHDHAAGFAETVRLTHRLGNDEDVAEQDRRIESESPNRLERDFGGKPGRLNQFQKRMLLLQFAILRQGAPGLPHQPDGRAIRCAAVAGIEKPPAIRRVARDGGRVGVGVGCNGGHVF